MAHEALFAAIRRHCESQGYREGPGVNNFVPHSARHAFGMARRLIAERFDRYVAIAPEGHIYGFFFERLGQPVESIDVDYPPTRATTGVDLATMAGQSVLLIEDDIIGGRTLRLVVEALRAHGVRALALYLGHSAGIQHLSNVPNAITRVYLAERDLDDTPTLGREFTEWASAFGVTAPPVRR